MHKHGAHVIGQKFCKRQPLAVWRPRGSHDYAPSVVQIGVHFYGHRSAFFDINVPKVQALVGEGNFLAVRRPRRAIEE